MDTPSRPSLNYYFSHGFNKGRDSTYVFRRSIFDRKLEELGSYKLFVREDNRCTHWNLAKKKKKKTL